MGFSYEACSRIPEPLEPYGDIAGLGVVLSFVISAWLTVLILVAYYIFSFNPHTDPFSDGNPTTTYSPNPLDVFLAKYTKYFRIGNNFQGALAEDAFQKCIISLADAQLITGISILVSAYMSLKHGQGLTAYHWKMMISLAWFSSVTHLSALSFLRSYLAKHPKRRLWRLIMMLILLILLVVGFIPTGHFNFISSRTHIEASAPAKNQIEFTMSIDLGQSLYPQDCDNPNDSHYYANELLYSNISFMALDAELLRNGTIGPANCTISGKAVFQPKNLHDSFYFYEEKYLRIIGPGAILFADDLSVSSVAVLYESPAVCFFKGGMDTSSDAFVSMTSSLLLLIYGYLIRASKTFEASSKLVSLHLQSLLIRRYENYMRKWGRFLSQISAPMIVAAGVCFLPIQASVYCTVRVFLHLYTSMFAEVFSVLLSAIWGTLIVKENKNLSSSDPHEENDWTFGQIIAIALLSSSLVPIFKLFYQLIFEARQQWRNANIGALRNDVSSENAREENSAGTRARSFDNTPVVTETSSTQIHESQRTHNENLTCPDGINSQNSPRLRPSCSHHQTPSLNDAAINQAGSTVSSAEAALHASYHLIVDGGHLGGLNFRIERLLQESMSAYEEVWTRSTFIIMSGPFTVAILQLLPVSRLMISRIFPGIGYDEYQPTAHLVSSAKMLAFLPCFIQQYIYLRLRIKRLEGNKKRYILTILMVTTIATAAIVLCIFITDFILIACIMTGVFCQLILLSGEFCSLMKQHYKEKGRQRRELRSAQTV